MLVIVEDRNVHLFFQTLLDDEAFRRLDVFKVDAAESRTHQLDRLAELVRVFGVQFDVDAVHVGKTFEQNRLTFHHRLRSRRAKVAQTKNRRTVRNHRNKVALVGVVVNGFGCFSDGFARNGNARRICQRQIPLGGHWDSGLNLPLAWSWFQMESKCIFFGDLSLGHRLFVPLAHMRGFFGLTCGFTALMSRLNTGG